MEIEWKDITRRPSSYFRSQNENQLKNWLNDFFNALCKSISESFVSANIQRQFYLYKPKKQIGERYLSFVKLFCSNGRCTAGRESCEDQYCVGEAKQYSSSTHIIIPRGTFHPFKNINCILKLGNVWQLSWPIPKLITKNDDENI